MALNDNNLTVKPFSDVIRRAVTQCAEAQQSGLETMLKEIEKNMFVTQRGKKEVAMLHFSFESEGRQYTIKLPLITVVPPQIIQIHEAEFNFNVIITKVDTSNTRKEFQVRYAPSRSKVKSTQSSVFDLRNIVNVNIKAADLGISGGMSRLLELATTRGIQVRTVEP